MSNTIRILLLVAALLGAENRALAAAKLVTAGREGAFYVSSNDGKTWQRVRSGVPTYLNGITSDNRGAFVAVGAKGVILRSTNDGKTWKKIVSPVSSTLAEVAFDEVSDRMVAVGALGTVLRSDDQGKTWTQIPTGTKAALYGIASDAQGVWVAVGMRGQVITSSDDAETFSLQEPATRHQLNDLTYAKGHFVAAGVSGTVVSSADGGVTWKEALTGSKMVFEGVAVDDLGNVLAVGWKGSVYRSENGGESWSQIDIGSTERLYAATPFGERGFVITGGKGASFRSEDGGATWTATKKKNGSKNLETIARARLPNLGLGNVHLSEACELVVTLRATGPARLPPFAWDGRVKLALSVVKGKARPKPLIAPLSLADLDPEKKLLIPGNSITVKVPGVTVAAGKTQKLKLVLDPGKKLVQTSRRDDVVEAEVTCEAK